MGKLADEIRRRAKELESQMQCNCDLDNWEPERSSGHSWVCRIHKKAVNDFYEGKIPRD